MDALSTVGGGAGSAARLLASGCLAETEEVTGASTLGVTGAIVAGAAGLTFAELVRAVCPSAAAAALDGSDGFARESGSVEC